MKNKEEFNLSEKECNILTNQVWKPEFEILETKETLKLIVKENEKLVFKKGYFEEDVKEFIKELKEIINTDINERVCNDWSDDEMLQDIIERIDKLAGDKLK